jgi:hypothetical protein
MKTIIVIYTNSRINKKSDIGRRKKYSFNTSGDVLVGDMLNSHTYDTKMQVVKVLGKSHKYYNSSTGKLSNTYTSTSQWEVRTLEVRDTSEDIIYASIVSEK